jgi:hypothetical protein
MNKFIDYISFPEHKNIHPEFKFTYPPFQEFVHLIVYGPSGVGKYTQVLKILQHYSPSHLKIEKKMVIDTTYIKFSDVHYEVDMSLLVCNSKLLWNDIYQQIVDIIQSKTDKRGFIVCKNFHTINKELLDCFYSYMQTTTIKFMLISDAVSFLPYNITSKCKMIPVKVPSALILQECKPDIHYLKTRTSSDNGFKLIHDYITTMVFNPNQLREQLYSILIFDTGVEKLINYLLLHLNMTTEQRQHMIEETVSFVSYFTNNYRPIFHLEKYIYSIIKIIHKLD